MIVEELPFWAKIIHDSNIKGGGAPGPSVMRLVTPNKTA